MAIIWFQTSICWSQKSLLTQIPSIYVANNSQMLISHIGNISMPTCHYLTLSWFLDFPWTWYICRTTMCRIHKKEQIIRIDYKVGCLFELISLKLSNALSSCASIVSFEIWYSRLGHVSFSILGHLISSDHLNSIDNKHFDYMPCNLGKCQAFTFWF